MRQIVCILAVLCMASVGTASTREFFVQDSVMFTNVESGLTPISQPATMAGSGGVMVNTVRVSGDLTEIATATYASEARIDISLAGGVPATFQVRGSDTTSYDGTISVSLDNAVTPFAVPAGPATYDFYESYSDGDDTVDQVWDTVTIEFINTVVTDGSYAVGALPADGTPVSMAAMHNVTGGLDFYHIELTGGGVGPGGYLNIQTSDPLTGDSIDTELGIFDPATGNLIATDDDGQVTALGSLYSMLSFGVDDPIVGDGAPGSDGETLTPGSYTVVLGGYDSNFEDITNIADLTPGISAGDYDIQFTYQAVPEPGTLALTALFGTALSAFGMRKRLG